ncbi:MAG: sensor histidine kinase [Chloroflexi bacterium]|nr:sensor histidine kinase [Chloroflexota bacterium]MDL1883041.1 HAMP domain-containing histidine kinase [Anaerolineae bacterium CFX8]
MNGILLVAGSELLASLQPEIAQAGLQSYEARTGAEALRLLAEVQPQAALVEVSGADINGVQICGQLKSSIGALRVMALHRGEAFLHRAALAAGADAAVDYPRESAALRDWLMKKDSPALRHGEDVLLGSRLDDVLDTTAMLVHDLKSPIGIVISTLEVLISMHMQEGSSDGVMRLLRGALSAAYRQMHLVLDMLDLIRLDVHAYELDCHPCNLPELVKDFLASEGNAIITAKKLQHEVLVAEAPLVACVDATLIWRMLNALIDNVVKFTVQGDLLRISIQPEDDRVALTFTDNGRSIFPGYERRIVERAPRSKDREAGTRTSVAMGLPFVYAAARAQGGEMTAASDPKTGMTTFKLTFPAVK